MYGRPGGGEFTHPARKIPARSRALPLFGSRWFLPLLTQCVALLLAASLAGRTAGAQAGALEPPVDPESEAVSALPPVPNEILVRFRDGVAPARREAALRRAAPRLQRVRHLPQPARRLAVPERGPAAVFSHLAIVETSDADEAVQALERLAAEPDVLYAEPHYRLRLLTGMTLTRPNDFEFARQWALENYGQNGALPGNDIGAPAAWSVITDARSVRVVVIDTGVDYFHPDLAANVWVNAGEIPGNGLDDDGNGYVDDVHGYDFVSDDSDPMDDHAHGTHVAGIIGAVGNNRIGVAGVCWQARLMALKAFDDRGEGTVAGVIAALDYARANGAHLINASWGQTDKSRALLEALTAVWESGILIVAAAGNERSDTAPLPAAYEPVLAVAALNAAGQRAGFSNYGPFVDLAAPGDAVLSTTPNSRYDLLSGTSMAAPHVTGAAALLWARHPDFTAAEVANVLRNTVDEIATDRYVGVGRLHVGRAVRVQAPLPRAHLRVPALIAGRVDVHGAADGERFAAYRLEFGAGTYPASWTVFHTSAEPVTDGVLYRDFATDALGEGVHTLRLVVRDVLGQEAQDRAVVEVRNVQITAPASNDSYRAGELIEVRGTVFGAGRTYTLEHGRGFEPASWSAAGIALVQGGQQQVFDGLLATWDTRQVKPDEFYTLRLRARVGEQVVGEWRSSVIYLDSQLRPGWPVRLPSTGVYSTNDWRHFTVADLDGDGRQEILRVHPGSPPGAPARLLVLAADGRRRWSQELAPGEPVSDIPAVGDLDGDGFLEILTDAGEHRWLYAFRHDGAPQGGAWPVRLPGPAAGKALADLDRDGRLEVILLANAWAAEAHQPGWLMVLNAQAQPLANWRVDLCRATAGWPRRLPAVGNFDADRDLEIVAPTGCNGLALFDLSVPDGPVWRRDFDGEILASPVAGDLDGDGRDEVAVGLNDAGAVNGRGFSGGLHALDGYGNYLSGWPVLVDASFATPLALADLDGDDRLEIVAVNTGWRQVHVLQANGFHAPGWPVSLGVFAALRAAPVVGDGDGDGSPDVVLPVPGVPRVAWTTPDLSLLGGLRAWNRRGEPIELQRHGQVRGLVMEFGSGSSRNKAAQAVLTDLDGNGRLDLLSASIDDVAYWPNATRKERCTLYAWELPVPHQLRPLDWPMFQRDIRRSGYAESPRATNRPPVVSSLPNQTIPLGGAFLPLVLDRYVQDPDHAASAIQWTVEAAGPFRVMITPQRWLQVEPPAPDWTGSQTLRLIARDPEGATDSTLVTFAVKADYQPPLARDDNGVTLEDTPVDIPVLANDTHPLGLAPHVVHVG